MENKNSEFPKDLNEALEELNQIRELVDRSRMIHPIRGLLRPLMPYSVLIAPVVVLYGIGAQRILDNPVARIWGFEKNNFLFYFSLILVAGVLIGKALISLFLFRDDERLLMKALRKTYNKDYLRLVIPSACLTAAVCIVFIQQGVMHLMVGLITAAIGSVWTMAYLVFPFPEFKPITFIGLIQLVLGICAMFIFPGFPFYKLALLWGFGFTALGLSSLWVSKRHGEE